MKNITENDAQNDETVVYLETVLSCPSPWYGGVWGNWTFDIMHLTAKLLARRTSPITAHYLYYSIVKRVMSTEEHPNKKQKLESSSAPTSPNGKNAKTVVASSVLDQLKSFTVIVADTGEFSLIQQFSPQDATTNPSLILKAATNTQYQHLIDEAISYGLQQHQDKTDDKNLLELIMDKLSVNFGVEISKLIPGYVSIEVDARLSFDTAATIRRAQTIIRLAEAAGLPRSRVLIKIAATYEGILAGKALQEEGIFCNLTLVFSLIQAAFCAENNITLISPFVGRILDWHKAKTGLTYDGTTDPGVLSVKKIYQYFKKFNYSTIVMGE